MMFRQSVATATFQDVHAYRVDSVAELNWTPLPGQFFDIVPLPFLSLPHSDTNGPILGPGDPISDAAGVRSWSQRFCGGIRQTRWLSKLTPGSRRRSAIRARGRGNPVPCRYSRSRLGFVSGYFASFCRNGAHLGSEQDRLRLSLQFGSAKHGERCGIDQCLGQSSMSRLGLDQSTQRTASVGASSDSRLSCVT